jgi:hypothetical protein
MKRVYSMAVAQTIKNPRLTRGFFHDLHFNRLIEPDGVLSGDSWSGAQSGTAG